MKERYKQEVDKVRDIKNKQDLAKFVELYKTGKITKYSLEAELSKAISEASEPVMISVSLVTEQDGNTNSTFGVASLPEMAGGKALNTILVDQEAVISLLRSEEVVEAVIGEASRVQSVLKDFIGFHSDRKGKETSAGQALEVLLKIYAGSLRKLSESLPEAFSRLRESRTIQSAEAIESEAAAIGSTDDELRFVVERLTISKKLPQLIVLAASKLSKELSEGSGKGAKIQLFYRDDAPVMKQFYQQRRALSDGTYTDNKMSKVIAHDYKPETNQ
jgi:hypothetical protein